MELIQICVKELLNNKDNVAIGNIFLISLELKKYKQRGQLYRKEGEYV